MGMEEYLNKIMAERKIFGTGVAALRDDGKSTFYGLLKQTLSKYNTEYLVQDNPKDQPLVEEIMKAMKDNQKFPPYTPLDQHENLCVLLGFKNNRFPKERERGLYNTPKEIFTAPSYIHNQDYIYTILRIVGTSSEDIEMFRNRVKAYDDWETGWEKAVQENPIVAGILHARTPIFIIDASKLNYTKDKVSYGEVFQPYDFDIKNLITQFVAYRNMIASTTEDEYLQKALRKRVAFIFTKCDEIDDQIKKDIGFKNLEEMVKKGEEKEYWKSAEKVATDVANNIFKNYMHETGEAIRGAGGIAYMPLGGYFFSWVEIDRQQVEGGKIKRKLKVTPDNYNKYPVLEYKRLLKFIKDNIDPMESDELVEALGLKRKNIGNQT